MLVLAIAIGATSADDDPADKVPAELRKQHPLPAKFESAAGDDAVRKLVIRRHNALRDVFYHILKDRDAPKHPDDISRLMELPLELARLQVELEPDPCRRLARLVQILVTAKSVEEFFRERVRIGQVRPQEEYRATAERLGVEALAASARLVAGRCPPTPKPPQDGPSPVKRPGDVLPPLLAPAVADEPVEAILVRRYDVLARVLELELQRGRFGCFGPMGSRNHMMSILKEMAALQLDTERNPGRLVENLERLLVAARTIVFNHRERVRVGQDPPQLALWAEADLFEIEVYLVRAKKAAGLLP